MNTNPSAKTVVCYGDSNTWGNVPRSDDRYPRDVRWPGALQDLLGDGYDVIEEGLCGRTFTAMDAAKQHRTGITHLQSILETNDPVDLVIVMLGTNDMKDAYGLSAEEVAQDLEETIFLIKSEKLDLAQKPRIMVVCPPPVIEPSVKAKGAKGQGLDERMARAVSISKDLAALYEEVALRHGCAFIDAGKHISSSGIDGYHLDKETHLALAKAIEGEVLKMKL